MSPEPFRGVSQRRGQPTVKGTELDTRLKVAIGVGTFVLGLFTVIVPTFAIPDCVPENMAVPPPPVKPFEPFVRPEPSPSRPLLGVCASLLFFSVMPCALLLPVVPGLKCCNLHGLHHVIEACQLWCNLIMHAYKHCGCWDVSHSIRAAPLHRRGVAPLACVAGSVHAPGSRRAQPDLRRGPCHWRGCNALASWLSFSSKCCAQLPRIGALATRMPVVSVAGASEPLCRAPQTVEGTTFIHAQPGRARELATILESMPMSVR